MRGATGQVMRLLRRSTALALAITGVWVLFRAAPAPTLVHTPAVAAALLRSQLPGQPDSRPLWQRLVLSQSPVLSGGLSLLPAQPTQDDPAPEQEPADEDLSEPPLHQVTDETPGILSRTMTPTAAQTYLQAGDIYIANRADKQADVTALASAPVHITLTDGPQILILHSHGSEAYSPTDANTYTPSDPYRTTDCNYNVVRVGEEMARVLRQQGFQVLHDTNLYDYPVYNEAYDRSLAAAQRWLTQYPSIRIILDVHRDALSAEDGTIYKVVSEEEPGQAAQVMLVVGSDGTKTHPLWQENLTFAMRLQQQMLDDHNTLARPMVLRASRYNQHLSVGSVLVEVGSHGNSLTEALLGARLFAESAATVLKGLK